MFCPRLLPLVIFALGTSSLLAQSTRSPNRPIPLSAALRKDASGSWIQQTELTASDGALGNLFGWSVAVDGNTAVVGAYGSNNHQGSAYVFVQSGGSWSQQAELTASDGAPNDWFGSAVAINGGTVVVGALGHNGTGAAYVFVENAGTWSQQAELTASDGAAQDDFGLSVAVSGNVALVGSPFHTVGSNGDQGAAYVFIENGTAWSQQAELTASDGMAGDNLGYSVAVSGGTALAGAYKHNDGAAYVFVENDNVWSQQAELTASNGTASDWFGISVAISGGTAVVGARKQTVGVNFEQGAAYVFVQSGSSWSQQAELTASDGVTQDEFGNSVAIDGGTIVVGAWLHSVSKFQQGAAYVFIENDGTWSQQTELTASDDAAQDEFAISVGVSGSTAAVGTWIGNVNSNQYQGVAYTFGSSPPPYALSATPGSLNIIQEGQGTSAFTIAPGDGFSGSVSLAASNLPSGVTAVFNPNPTTTTSTLTLSAGAGSTTGATDVIVTGSSNSLDQVTRLALTVTPVTTLSLSPTSLIFANEVVGSMTGTKIVEITNTGATTLYPSISASANFGFSPNTCGFAVFVGETCKAKVWFMPTEAGPLTGTLTVSGNISGPPPTVTLSATGIAQATLTPASLTFPAIKVGKTSSSKRVTLKNHLPTTLTGIMYTTTGPFAILTSTCSTTLNSNQTCTISVTFSPTTQGNVAGTLVVSDSANNSPQTVSLSGTGD